MSENAWKEKARWIVGRAVLAPSSHNTQPWRFRLSVSAIDLYADRTRALPVNDPDDRELAMSCGCALMNVRVAAASQGLSVQVRLFPKPEESDFLARASLSLPSCSVAQEGQLVEFIARRRTYRKRFAPRDVSETLLDQLKEAARQENTHLLPLTCQETRKQAADLVAEGDKVQWSNRSWRHELAAWMHPKSRGDGLTIPALASPVIRLIVRTIDMGKSVGARNRQIAGASPVLAVLSTDRDQPIDWLHAGQALQRVLLLGCKHGLQASYLNQPIQVASVRLRLRTVVGNGFPQTLLRIGYPLNEVSPAPRRKLDEVIEWPRGEKGAALGEG